MEEFKLGRTGNEILKISLDRCKEEGLNASIYSHPLGFHGHAAGPTIGLWNNQVSVPGKGDYPLYYSTCYAIELNNKYNVPEWDNQQVTIGLEEDGVYTKDGCKFIDGRMTSYYLIK